MGQKYVDDVDITPVSTRPELYEEGSIHPVYRAKASLLSSAIQEIGMGKYQVRALYDVLSVLLIASW